MTAGATDAAVAAILARLESAGSEDNRAGMARFGINVERAYGTTVAALRVLARETGRDPELARGLWASGVHEARILACLIHDPASVEPAEREIMVRDLDSWDLCDQFTNNLARRLPKARELARGWLGDAAPFVKRAGLTLLASLAVHDKAAPRAVLEADARAVAEVAADDRQPVKKAVSWALRQIGKRDEALRHIVLATAEALVAGGDKRARWAARDVLRELSRPEIVARVASRSPAKP